MLSPISSGVCLRTQGSALILALVLSTIEALTANRVAGEVSSPAPTPPYMRVRIRRFI